MEEYKYYGKRSLLVKIIAVVCALALAVVTFFAGYFTHKLTQPSSAASLEWALEMIDKYYYGEFDESQITGATLQGLSSLLDPYSEYYTPEEYANLVKTASGKRAGVGISYVFVEGKGAQLVTVVGGSPAAGAGLRSGDVLVSGERGGVKTEFTSDKAFSDFLDGAAENERFALITSRGKRAEVARQNYTSSYAVMYTNGAEYSFDYSLSSEPAYKISDRMNFLPEGTAYIGLSQFYGGAAAEFGKLVKKFNSENCTSLILDLRNNGGGQVDLMCEIAGLFTSADYSGAKLAMSAKYRNGYTEKFHCSRYDPADALPKDTKIYAMANAGTASASEALLGILVSYGRIEERDIFLSDYSENYLDWLDKRGGGRKTGCSYGKGIMQSTFTNSKGEAIKLTVAEIFWPNGTSIHGRGFTAGGIANGEGRGCTALPAEWLVTEGDEELKSLAAIVAGR